MRRPISCLACGAVALWLLNFYWLAPPHISEEAAACSLTKQLELVPPLPAPAPAAGSSTTDEVRLFWWYRFEGRRRSVNKPEHFACSDGLQCISDSRTSAFASAHGVVVWSGPDHRRGGCLPPQRPEHTWVLEFSEPPTIDARTESELYSQTFAQRFEVKVSHELDSDVVLTALHPLVEGGTIPPDEWLHHPPAAKRPRMAIVWLASYCGSPNRRDVLARRLQESLPPSLPLLSIGRCLHNHDEPLLQAKAARGRNDRGLYSSKMRALASYAFCLVTENSAAKDYVTEKLFHAFASGCLPIYYGTEDVTSFLPTPKAVLQVLAYPTLAALVGHLSHLAANRTAFAQHMAWRGRPKGVRAWWDRMQSMTGAAETPSTPAIFCAICKAVREARHAGAQRRQLHASPRPRHAVWPPLLDGSPVRKV
jgi:hypothetical protein